MKVFFYVQHLLGIGHLKRAATLSGAMRSAGFDVTLASGGLPVRGLEVFQLPPASSPDFKTLLDEHGRPVDEAWKARRRDALLAAFRAASPDVLVVELFPFGRRQMRFELMPLLEEASSAFVVCSVRDILQPNPAREDEALECFERHFDRLMVHGDPRIAPLERSFGKARALEAKLHYTGYVVEDLEAGDAHVGQDEILISAGGGAVGRKLLETAIAARPLTRVRDKIWRVLAGVKAQGLESLRSESVIVERSRNDFTLRLRNCVLSVSQAGYNTVVETLQAGARAVLVPFAGGGEMEQTLRARLLAERGLVQIVEEDRLTPAALAAAIDRAAAGPRPASGTVELDGARRSAELLRAWVG